MKRLLWLGIGLAAGALVVRAVSKKARTYSPSGIAAATRDSGRNLLDSMRDFVDDVQDGMHEREQELHAAFAEGVVLTDEVDAEQAGDDFDELFGPDPAGGGDPGPGGAAARRPDLSARDPAEGTTR